MIGSPSQSKLQQVVGVITHHLLFNVNSIYLGGYHIPAGFKN
ncbi:hypothetical protein PALI_a3610 [Pseudoalteromonas aliena SW19]|uniref:Uncharacterized protein n=1 Tax=Pseudoalteromonas aliena SW19 TaxID=1314866 RepID=A0ABR9DWT8_9GAMM|nr:hypothetical protein [Pseudoalteromonas aliena SW19]